MHAVSQTFILNLTPQVTRCKQRVDRYIVPILNYGYFGLSWKLEVGARSILKRHFCFLNYISNCIDAEISSNQFEDFSVSVAETDDTRELKISVEVSGNKTQRIFDDVFKRMVAAAQPIPGFRRVKGGKTPDIPKNILLEVLGPSKVFKEVIKKIINSTVAEYVEKERLTVSTDLRVEQSFEDLENQNSSIPPARKPFVPHSGSRNCNRTNPTVVGGKPFIDGEHEIPFSRLIQNPPTVLYQNHFIVADSKSFVPPPRKSLIARNPSSHSASPNHSRTNPTVVDGKPFVRWKWKALKLEDRKKIVKQLDDEIKVLEYSIGCF
ncbi:Trigger factor [Vigna unguiculata]|uniref:peptidylprolyl isomerase n=1 Tax=Vigna unguiculata TaxID=3917 RepID=A0A4D6M5Z8_VIGUN|nr:Trigger factor [Vigna unguiculata]